MQLRRPSRREVEDVLGSTRPFNYPEVGATADLCASGVRESLASRYDVDRHEFELGTGQALFERARSSLLTWRHFEIPWLQFRGSGAAAPGQVVATAMSVAGLWFLNPCRVVYVAAAPDQLSLAFAYGTLSGHAESGEEQFRVSLDPTSGRVRYEIAAFSRPAMLVSNLGYPLARRLQKRFAASSARALALASA